MQNAQNIVVPSMLPQGPPGPVMPMLINVNRMPLVPMDTARSPSPVSAFASALASASPENRHAV